MAEHGGAVVNISSVAGVEPAPGIGDVRRQQGDADRLTETLAVELGPTDPGQRGRTRGREDPVRQRSSTRDARRRSSSAYPLKRLGVPEDVAGAVAFLLSDDAAWLTGQTITLDGGVTLTGGV